jgi:hypothetical protein
LAVATSLKTTAFGSGVSTPPTAAVATTSSIAIAAGETVMVASVESANTTVGSAHTISDTQSLSWTQIGTGWTYDNGTNPRERVHIWWYQNNTGSTVNTAVTVTGNTGLSTDVGVTVAGITGNNTTFTNTIQANSTTGDPAPSLGSAPASTSAVLGFGIFSGSGTAITAPTGWTELTHFNPSNGARSRNAYSIHDDTTPAQSATFSTANSNATFVLVEIPISGSTTYNDTISESATPATTLGAAATFAPTVSESGTSGNTLGAAASFAPTLVEAATAADGLGAAATIAPALSEGLTGSDSNAATATFAVTVSESAAGADSFAGGLILSSDLSEMLSASFAIDVGAVIDCAVDEAISPSDTITVSASFTDAIFETWSLIDAYVAIGGSLPVPRLTTIPPREPFSGRPIQITFSHPANISRGTR